MARNKIATGVSAAFAALVLFAQPSIAQDGVNRTGDIVFAEVDGRELLLDLYTPAGVNNAPVLIFAHGGGWARGSRERVPHIDLVSAGYAIASLDYRLSGEAKFPAQIYDLKAAVRFLRANASELGIDPNRIGASGSSAGAHLAQLLGVTNGSAAHEGNVGEHDNVSSDVSVIVSYYGASNFTTILDQSTEYGYGGARARSQCASWWTSRGPSRNSRVLRAPSFTQMQATRRSICFMAIWIRKCRSIRPMRDTASIKRLACRCISKSCTAPSMAANRSTIPNAPQWFAPS